MTEHDRLEIEKLKVFKEQILAFRKSSLSKEEQIKIILAAWRGENKN